MILKVFLCFVAAIFLAVCTYAFVEGVSVVRVKNPHAGEQYQAEADGPLKKAIDKKSSVFCEIESFWAKYDIWGDTDAVFSSPEDDEAAEQKADKNVGCDEPAAGVVSQQG